ncbi:hypothetical protein [Paenibacillus sp. FSL H7-0714]|uniref:hypothetical protein n=1 Tax=Paenibacillus sp. FSL H7-0714 TaxID=2954735 RepID=UPI0030FB9160
MNIDYKKRLIQRVLNGGERDKDFEEYVQELLDSNRLESDPVIGIAKRIVSHGVPSLSDAQLETFINYGLLADNYLENCEQDYIQIRWSDMVFAVERGLCDRCRHMQDKND